MGTLLLLPLLFIIIAIVIGALIIMLATRMVAGFSPTFGTCVLAAIIATIATVILHMLLGAVLGAAMGGRLVSLVAGFLLNSFVINMFVKTPTGGQMGFGKAALVSVVEYVIFIVVGVILAILFGAAMVGGMSALSH